MDRCWSGPGIAAQFDKMVFARAIESACTAPLLALIAELEAESERLRSELERIKGEA